MPADDEKNGELKAAIAALEAQRSLLGDDVVGPAIAALRAQLEKLNEPSAVRSEERKIVTVLFVDVSGFTALAEKLDPEEVRSVINACFDELVPVVQKYDGTIDKFIGDEIMALFGAPVAHENDPERALRAALEMMERISVFNQQHGTTLSLHIGVNSGPVVAGAIGSQGRKDYSVMGDAVNLAARLEDASPDGQIFVGPSTHRLTKALFDFETVAPVMLKGKAEPLVIHRLVGLKIEPLPVRGIEGIRSDLIGRDQEVARIGDAVQALLSGNGGIIAVVGEAGVGKSRLLAESLGVLGQGITLAEGRALSHTTGMSYWLARDMLRDLIGCSENASANELDQALRNSLSIARSLVFDQVYPYLATLLQLPLNEDMRERVRFLSTEALQARILRAFRQYVSGRAGQQPLLILCEDVHWCDPSSMLLLKDLLPLTREYPLLIVLAFRPEQETDELQQAAVAVAADNFHLLKLLPLGRQQSGALVERLLQVAQLPAKLRDLILDRAEGNPFFIEELLRSLLDSAVLSVDKGQLVVGRDILETPVPDTVQGVIAARMDRLSSDRKETLQTASVIGRVFPLKVLQHILPSATPAGLDTCVSELCRLQFIQKRNEPAPNDEFVFKHAITHDVAYQTLLKARRREIHQHVGEALETIFPARASELAPILGYHFERAEIRDKAFRYLKSAGEHAQAVFANAEAEAYYRSAVKQGDALLNVRDDKEMAQSMAEVEEALGDVLLLRAKNEEARSAYNHSLARMPGEDRIRRSAIHRKIGSAYTVDRDYTAMGRAFDAGEKELGEQPVGPPEQWWSEKMQILLERLHLLYWQGMSEEMTKLAERHRADIEQRGTPIQRGKFFQMLGLSELTGARYVSSEKAVHLAELAVSTSRGSTDLAVMSHLRFTAGLAHLFRGNLPEAIEHGENGLSLAERVGDLILQTRCLAYLAVAFRRSRDPERTRATADRVIGLATQVGMPEYVAMAKASLAWLAWYKEDYAEAKSLGKEALRLWHGMADPYGVDWHALLPLIAVAVAEQQLDDAIEYTRGLVGENQHPIPPLAVAGKEVIESEGATTAKKKAALERLIKAAREIGYL